MDQLLKFIIFYCISKGFCTLEEIPDMLEIELTLYNYQLTIHLCY